MTPEKPASAHVSTTTRTTSSVPADSSSQRRTSPAFSAQRSDEIDATTPHLNRWVEPRGRRLVGDRQQERQSGLRRPRAAAAPFRTRRRVTPNRQKCAPAQRLPVDSHQNLAGAQALAANRHRQAA